MKPFLKSFALTWLIEKISNMGNTPIYTKFTPREPIGVCEKCGNAGIFYTGVIGTNILCNNCHDKMGYLD